jgi:hypothetical protein
MTYVFGFSFVELAVIVAAGASTLVGCYIGYQAYRALQLYDDRSMFYLSVGLILLTVVTYSTAFVGTLLLRLELLALPAQDGFRARGAALSARRSRLHRVLAVDPTLTPRRRTKRVPSGHSGVGGRPIRTATPTLARPSATTRRPASASALASVEPPPVERASAARATPQTVDAMPEAAYRLGESRTARVRTLQTIWVP